MSWSPGLIPATRATTERKRWKLERPQDASTSDSKSLHMFHTPGSEERRPQSGLGNHERAILQGIRLNISATTVIVTTTTHTASAWTGLSMGETPDSANAIKASPCLSCTVRCRARRALTRRSLLLRRRGERRGLQLVFSCTKGP